MGLMYVIYLSNLCIFDVISVERQQVEDVCSSFGVRRENIWQKYNTIILLI